jgi:hypothetical protein
MFEVLQVLTVMHVVVGRASTLAHAPEMPEKL